MKILVLNGPNLNLLGRREPAVYGSETLADLEQRLETWAVGRGIGFTFFQSNHEGALIDQLHQTDAAGVVLNPGAFTHTSYALFDAISGVDVPVVETNISNVKQREPWRAQSVLAEACVHAIYGRGLDGYEDAAAHLAARHEWPAETYRYGQSDEHLADLRLPDGEGPFPVVVLLHGGAWLDPYTRDLLDWPAIDLARRGYATWNVEYRRSSGGGAWPAAAEDVAAAIDHLANVPDLNVGEVAVIGHSAGGHLGWMGATRTKTVEVSHLVGLAPILDLDRYRLTANLFSPDMVPIPEASPHRMVPVGIRQSIVHGADDTAVTLESIELYAEAAGAAGDDVSLTVLEGVGHREVVDIHHDSWSTVVGALA